MKPQAGPSKHLCDYCHKEPKFPPYDYCSKTCGSRARGAGGTNSRGPPLCKQCNQKPVYQGHQFCGKKCANTWQTAGGPTSTSSHGSSYGSSYGPSQPQQWQQPSQYMTQPPMQYPPTGPPQPFQGPGQGGAVTGILNGFKGLVSQYQQSQQPRFSRQVPPNFSHMQQNPGYISPPPLMISPHVNNSMSSGMSVPMSPGSNQPYYTPSTSPGIQDPNANGLADIRRGPSPPLPPIPAVSNHPYAPGQYPNMAVSPPSYSVFGETPPDGSDSDGLEYTNQDLTMTPNSSTGSISVQGQSQTQLSVRVVSSGPGTGGSENGDIDPNDPALSASLQYMSNPPSSTCRLMGCEKTVFVDPATDHQSEYCSQKHREEAVTSGQVDPCIMCKKMPRSLYDHFCSKACREKALSA